ncbi:phage tail tape measure protein [Nocardia sp. CY41]|uniref:phage tail tape measure protein n=1 Tax=Nocardia sp. CY41 TaxID=2608686 RepID=UPI001357D204|nr:phage tail tape measure protein [Nocardia sp. CY41]
MANAIELATAYVTIVPDTSRIGPLVNRALQQTGAQAGRTGGQSMGSGLGEGLRGLGGKAGPIGAALAAAASVAGISAGAILAKSIAAGMENERQTDLVQARLGVDEATMRKIGTAAGNAYGNVFGESIASNMDTARRAIQSGLLDPNATAQDTQRVIEQLTGISDLMGEEIPAVSRAAGQAIKTGLAGNAVEAFDLFAAAEKNGLNVSEDFLDTVTEYGTQFRKLGLSGPEAIGLINQAVKGGARDVDVAADAIKEFSIRVVDGSKSTTEAFQTLGFDADDLAAKFAAGGSTARSAVGDLLGEVRKIEDPVKRNQISLALFGTQFEDLGDALNNFNLDTAAGSLGKVAGAAQDALGTMGDNAATSLEGAKRSIEVSMTGVQNALAQAFGPSLEKVGNWVKTHQPEITGFFIKLADATFVTLDALLAFSSGSLRAFATFAEGIGGPLQSVLQPLGLLTTAFGKLTGNKDAEEIGNSLRNFESTLTGAADKARSLADTIDERGRPAIAGMRQSFLDSAEAARASQEIYRAVGETVQAIPGEHSILLHDNTPEATARLEALGLKVTTLPDGQVEVTALTEAGQRIIDGFIQQNTGRKVPLTAELTTEINQNVSNIESRWTRRDGGIVIPGRAFGGIAPSRPGLFRGIGGPRDDANLLAISDTEFIVNAKATARHLPLLNAINAGLDPLQFMMGMVRGGARLWHGDYDGSLSRIGIDEDHPLVAAALGIRNLLYKGDYDGNLAAVGIDEDNPLISAALGLRSLAHGDYDGRLAEFGIEEDNPLVSAGLGAGALLRGDYNSELRRFGIEEDNPLVDAGIGLGGLMRGDYLANLRRFGLEEDDPLIDAALNTRKWLASLPGFADGGLASKRAVGYVRSHAGEPYQYGALDCSGILSGVYNQLTGKNVRFTTDSDFSQFGFVRGYDPNGFSIGTNGGVGVNGHMAGTLLGTNVESDATNGIQFGGSADGATAFKDVWHLPRDLWSPPETDDPSTKSGGVGGLGSGTGRTGLGGSGAGGPTGSGSGLGGSSGNGNGTNSFAGATPVAVVNWPSSFGIPNGAGTQSPQVTDFGPDVPMSTAPFEAPPTDQAAPAQQQHPFQGLPMTGDLFNGPAPWYLAATPEQALANLGTQAAGLAQKTGQGFVDYFQNNWKEMLNSGLAIAGMGATGGGGGNTTYNISGTDPMGAARAVERVHRRQTMVAQRAGGFGR